MSELVEDRNGQKEMEQIIRNAFGAMPLFSCDVSVQQNWKIKLSVKTFMLTFITTSSSFSATLIIRLSNNS